ncbi:ABC transporter permease [Pseudonocardia humida]|uniref:ABC transporter permease n=1 Tax=Pseudonocardia humida TaxID=2800819 RepID=A0ABT0ZXP7_9PSEU|nr:ABC transporter permease [Pseudonocardia humida]MCO1655399.1 ABC transporter permease [Pseudonocardia humida]
MTSATTTPTTTGTSTGSKVLALAMSETRLMLRNRTVAVSALFIPLVMGAFFAYSFTSNGGEDPSPFVFALVVASQLAIVVGMTVYVTTTITVVARRHTRVLKRMRTSGISDTGLLAATIAPTVVVGLLQLVLFVPFNAYMGVPVPADPLALALAALGGLALSVTAALATTVVTATPERAQITTLPLVFLILGASIALAVIPADGWWQLLALVPGAAIGELAGYGLLGGAWGAGVAGLPAVLPALVALVVWPVVFGVLAKRSFRWDPRN